jgi:hypothetical protein
VDATNTQRRHLILDTYLRAFSEAQSRSQVPLVEVFPSAQAEQLVGARRLYHEFAELVQERDRHLAELVRKYETGELAHEMVLPSISAVWQAYVNAKAEIEGDLKAIRDSLQGAPAANVRAQIANTEELIASVPDLTATAASTETSEDPLYM